MYEQLGRYGRYPSQDDAGRSQVTKEDRDRLLFKVPQLCNLARAAPYFHDGAVADLGEAVRILGRIQPDIELEGDQVADIVAFLTAPNGKAGAGT